MSSPCTTSSTARSNRQQCLLGVVVGILFECLTAIISDRMDDISTGISTFLLFVGTMVLLHQCYLDKEAADHTVNCFVVSAYFSRTVLFLAGHFWVHRGFAAAEFDFNMFDILLALDVAALVFFFSFQNKQTQNMPSPSTSSATSSTSRQQCLLGLVAGVLLERLTDIMLPRMNAAFIEIVPFLLYMGTIVLLQRCNLDKEAKERMVKWILVPAVFSRTLFCVGYYWVHRGLSAAEFDFKMFGVVLALDAAALLFFFSSYSHSSNKKEQPTPAKGPEQDPLKEPLLPVVQTVHPIQIV